MKNIRTLKTTIHSLLMTAMLILCAPVVAANSLDDSTIFAIFDEVNTVDIWTARLAAQKGHSEEVRALGRQVASDHEAVQQMARELVSKLGIVPTPPVNDKAAQEHAKTIAMLQNRSGSDFDRAYLLHEVKFHAGAIDAVKTVLLPALKNEAFRALILKVAPGFESHLAMTKALAKKMGYSQ
ncbi:MAG: DUF4142 domain-containing protein [Gammaproteobacteria bacterium]|nr:DUF4142 domain-containing protein [Gammaproteobacteria bacterium]